MTGRIIGGAIACLALCVGCVPAGGEEEDVDSAIRDATPAVLLDMFVPVEPDGGGMGGAGGEGGAGGMGGEGGAGGMGGMGGAGGMGGMGGAPAMGDADCRALDTCLRGCGDPECSRMCREVAPAEAGALYDAIFACARESGCTEPGGGLNEPCMQTNCNDERLACLGPPPPPDPLDCDGLSACLDACEAGDVECTDSCNGAATDEGRQAYDGLVQCLNNAACPPEDDACRRGACADFFEACFGAAVVPIGDDDCNELAGCINACPEGDQACTDGCFEASSPEAFNTYQEALDCLREAEPQCPPGDQECAQMLCATEIAACIPPLTPMGDLTCLEFDACIGECEGDQPCIDACVRSASQEGYDQLIELLDCFEMQCPEGSAPSCTRIRCELPYAACLGDIAVPRGNLSCLGFNDCLALCADGDDACVDRCIESSSPMGFDLLVIVSNCLADSGCGPEDAACQEANCGGEIQACINDF